jgi:hypothetical protein
MWLLKCNETRRRKEKIVHNKWLYINEEEACKKIISCNKITEFKNIYIFTQSKMQVGK